MPIYRETPSPVRPFAVRNSGTADAHVSYGSAIDRTDKLLSAGLPVVAVREALGDTVVIAESNPLPAGTNDWRNFTIKFQTGAATKAVTINIQRQACNVNPCPLVGSALFDELQLLKQ